MKKYRSKVLWTLVVGFLASCPSPMLTWIENPAPPQVTVPAPPPPVPLPQYLSSSDKAITSFSFGIEGEEVTIRAGRDINGRIPIKAILPAGSDITSLNTSIEIIGKSLSPASGVRGNFTSPVVYTVTATDGSTLEYAVEVHVKTAQSAEIVWLDLELGGGVMAEGVVTQPAGGQPGEIVLHVPPGTSLTNLTAKIAQTGVVVQDPAGAPHLETLITLSGDFSAPKTYTVLAEDGTAKTYTVTVVVDKSDVKEITAFSFSEYANNETVIIGAEAQHDGKYPIVVTVPVTANLEQLQPTITYKGARITGAGIQPSLPRTGNFDSPLAVGTSSKPNFTTVVPYTVWAEDGSTKEYEVTVYRSDLNTGKQITGFYFNLSNSPAVGAVGIINETAKTIAVTVPYGTNLGSLSPTIYHTGVSVSPISGEPRNFANSVASPVPYTVTARDGTTATYGVSVFLAANSAKAITAFDFADVPGETVVIGGTPDPDGKIPIVVTVPWNTDLSTTKKPVVTHTGASITGPGISGMGGPGTVSGTPANFTGPVDYTVTAEDGTEQVYSVTVVKTADPALDDTSDDASIDVFFFSNPFAQGTITGQDIAVTVPHDTDLTTLVPTIYFTGNIVVKGDTPDTASTPASELVGSTTVWKPAMSSPASIPADFSKSTIDNFSDPVKYTVTPLSRNSTEAKTYTVTVTVGPAPPASGVRAITFVSFLNDPPGTGVADVDLTCVISPVPVPYTSTTYPVEVIVPAGTNLLTLKPVILYKGASIEGPGEPFVTETHPTDPEIKGIAAGSVVDFTNSQTNPVTYRVTAANGDYSDYEISVRIDDNNVKEITGFYFTSPAAVGVIDQNAKTITVSVPNGTNLSALAPTVTYTGASLDPAPGSTVNFSSPVSYTVTARNGTAQPYTVKVIPKPASTKEITAISFPGAGVLETVIGALPDSEGYIPISVTVSGQTDIGALRPTITHTGVSITPPEGIPQTAASFTDITRHFGIPQSYRVTAEDGTYKDYAVSVHSSGGGAKIITGFVFKPENNFGLTVQAVGQINQDAQTIEVRVPPSVNLSTTTLAPTITYLGASLGYGTNSGNPLQVYPNTGSVGQSDTFTDTARNFSSHRYYTVTAQDPPPDNTREYTITVTQFPEVTIRYGSLRDDKFTAESLSQGTGLLTVSIITTALTFPLSNPSYGYETPFDWYVDGVHQPVSATQASLTIQTADFKPGRHQITVSAKRSSDNRHYTNLLYFDVKE